MTSPNLDLLDRFTDNAVTEEPPVFQEPFFVIKHSKPILAIDQTLGHTGWAILRWQDGLQSMAQGSWPRPTAEKGFAGSFAHADLLTKDLRELLMLFPSFITHIAFEMPSVRGHRTDSSLMAATVVSTVATIAGISHSMVNARHARKVLTGSADATKAQVKKVVSHCIPGMKSQKPFNTNVSDAAALGMVWMMENE